MKKRLSSFQISSVFYIYVRKFTPLFYIRMLLSPVQPEYFCFSADFRLKILVF